MKKHINEDILFKIDPRIFYIDDPRIKKYKQGECSQIEFLSSLTEKDPFIVRNNQLSIVTEYDINMKNNKI